MCFSFGRHHGRLVLARSSDCILFLLGRRSNGCLWRFGDTGISMGLLQMLRRACCHLNRNMYPTQIPGTVADYDVHIISLCFRSLLLFRVRLPRNRVGSDAGWLRAPAKFRSVGVMLWVARCVT